jgi:signal transduction histidine kinase/integral membrane sensor domain MASE1
MKLLIFISVVIVYIGLGMLSLRLATLNEITSPIWSPSGLAIGALVVFGTWLTPAIFVGAFILNFLASPATLLTVAGVATGNCLEAFVGAYLVYFILEKDSFKSYNEFAAILCASTLASMVSATFGVSSLLISGVTLPVEYAYTWYTWWSGDSIGILVLLPIFLEFHLNKDILSIQTSRKIFAAALFTIVIFGAIFFIFVKGANPAFAWVICPLLTFVGMYLEKFLLRSILILVAGLVVVLTSLGHSPFEFGSTNLNLIYVQSLLASLAFAVLFVRPLAMEFVVKRPFILTNIFGWSTIFITLFITSELESRSMNKDLDDLVQLAVQDLKETVNQHSLLLESGAALIQIKPDINKTEWQNYKNAIDVELKFDAIQSYGFVRHMQKGKELEFKREMQSRGIENFSIHTYDDAFSENYSDRYILTFLVPQIKNFQAIGLDLGSELQRRKAAEKARRTNTVTATEAIEFFNNGHKEVGFALFYPVTDVKSGFKGWTYTRILAVPFFLKALAKSANLLHIKISTNGHTSFQNYLSDNRHLNLKFLKTVPLEIFGQKYVATFFPEPEFFRRHSHSSAPLALMMTLLMLFVAGFLLDQLTSNQRTQKIILKKTQELENSKSQLIYSSKMASLGEMASGMAHEINNPITIILGKLKVLSLMIQDIDGDHQALENEIKKIENSTSRISKIVKGLRTFSRAADNDPFELVPLDTIIHETLDLCSERLKVNDIKLVLDKIPEVCLFCRPSQITQVFLNLFNNSSDALEGAKEKMVSVKFKIIEPDKIVITITDSGPGIAPEYKNKIMEPFFTTKDSGKGTGLGLSIAKGIIENHGGVIFLNSGQHLAQFIIELPLKDVGKKV